MLQGELHNHSYLKRFQVYGASVWCVRLSPPSGPAASRSWRD